MRLDRFAQIPIVYQGRVKPIDTLARNSLRIVSNRQTYRDDQGKKQPAIRWLLDVISASDAADKHEVFRIDNFDVQTALGLERRKGFRYANDEFDQNDEALGKQVDQAVADQRKPTRIPHHVSTQALGDLSENPNSGQSASRVPSHPVSRVAYQGRTGRGPRGALKQHSNKSNASCKPSPNSMQA